MKSKHDKSNGSSDRDSSSNSKMSKNGHSTQVHDDSMSGGDDDRSRSSSPRNDRDRGRSDKGDKVDHDLLSIYIGNVDYAATEEELRDTFISCGDIIRVTIIKNMKTGHPKGAAFIEFTDKKSVDAAMNLNGKEVKGRPLIVTTKKPRPENRPREPRPSYMQYDRRGPRQPMYGSSSYGSSSSYGGSGGRPYGSSGSRGGGGGGGNGYYHGGSSHMEGGRGRGGPPPMQMDQQMQSRMQPRYDPYKRPEWGGYDPVYMMPRGGGGSGGPPPQSQYYDRHNGGGHRSSGGGGGGGGPSPGGQRYSQPSFSRR